MQDEQKASRLRHIRELTFGKIAVIVPLLILAILGGQFLYPHKAASTLTVSFPPVGIGGGASTTGYYLVSSDGGVFTQGTDTFHGSLGSANIHDIVGMATTAGDNGYWLLGADGGVFAFGNAGFHGSLPGHNNGAFVGIAGASNGGYWIVDSSGQIYAYGTPSIPITNPTTNNSPFVGIAATADGNGFWLVDKTGQIFCYGDAGYHGAPSGVSNIVGITAGAGGGYWLTGSDGGVFSYGTAYYNSMGGQHLNGQVVGIMHTSDYKGYWLAASDGGVFAFGDAQFAGAVVVAPPSSTPAAPSSTPAPLVQNTTGGLRPLSGSLTPTANGASTTTIAGATVQTSNAGTPVVLAAGEVQVAAPATSLIVDTANTGYLQVTTDGGVFAQGTAAYHGSAGSNHVTNVVGAARPSKSDTGYYLVGSDGGVFAYNLPFEGSMGGKSLNKPIVGIAATSDGKGYWLVGADGGIFAFGDAKFYGSMGGKSLNQPIVGIADTPDDGGYWLVASDGGIFAFGDAKFYGSTGSTSLNKPIVGMAPTTDGKGYWLVASDGGIFAFGDAQFYGSMGSKTVNGWVVGMAAAPDDKGYYLQASDGAVFAFGSAKYTGRVVYPPPAVTLAATPKTVTTGTPLTLSWSSTNAIGANAFIRGDGIAGGYPTSGSTTATPSTVGQSNYTLTVVGAGGTVSVNTPVDVIAPPPTVSFIAAPQAIASGSASVLEWTSTNATSATISGIGPVDPNSTYPLTGLAIGSHSYTITVTGSGGTATATTTVTVGLSSDQAAYLAGLAGSGNSGVLNPPPALFTIANSQFPVIVNQGMTTYICVDYTYNPSNFPIGAKIGVGLTASINGAPDFTESGYITLSDTQHNNGEQLGTDCMSLPWYASGAKLTSLVASGITLPGGIGWHNMRIINYRSSTITL